MKQMLKLTAFAAIAFLTLGANAVVVRADSTITNDRVTLDPGTVIPVTLNTELSSNGSIDGDTFTATVDSSRDAYNSILQGATVDGIVRRAIPQEGSDPGTLELAFNRLRLADGSVYHITGTPTSLDSSKLTVDSNGVLVAKSGAKKNQSLTYAGIGAGAGALISILGNGKIKIEDILLGGGLGYAAGALLNRPSQVHDVDLKAGTPMGVLLGNRVLYHRRIQPDATIDTAPVGRPAYSSDNLKYYWYHGARWAYDPVTGDRFRVAGTAPNYHRTNRKYYSYHGHAYYLDLTTGDRVRLD